MGPGQDKLMDFTDPNTSSRDLRWLLVSAPPPLHRTFCFRVYNCAALCLCVASANKRYLYFFFFNDLDHHMLPMCAQDEGGRKVFKRQLSRCVALCSLKDQQWKCWEQQEQPGSLPLPRSRGPFLSFLFFVMVLNCSSKRTFYIIQHMIAALFP